MKTRLLVLLCISVICKFSKAQTLPEVVPPSPNAASIAQYVDMPVSTYTGVPSISIPLYTATSGKIQLPISLSYHASGIKVAQEASWVGLGWSLSAGGAITRQMRGQDDFETNINVDGFPREAAFPDAVINLGYGFYDFNDSPFGYNYNINDEVYFDSVRNGGIDGEPDIYFYNFLGYSGKLFFRKQGNLTTYEATPVEQNNMKFLYTPSTGQWEVTDGNGWTYFLKTPEITTNHSSAESSTSLFSVETVNTSNTPNFADHISAWYIDKVVTPEGDEITFEYDTVYHRTISQVSYSEVTGYIVPGTNSLNLNPSVPSSKYTASMQETDDVYLKRINFKNGYILFNSANRDDVRTLNSATPQLLDNIIVYNSNGTPLKKVDFNHSYFQSSGTTNAENLKRLRLDSVTESYWDSSQSSYNSLLPFTFSYNNTTLPPKNSIYTDYWGYNNRTSNTGAPNGMISTLRYNNFDVSPHLPTNTGPFTIYEEPTTWTEQSSVASISNLENNYGVTLNGINKKVNSIALKSGILTKITYPTGGTRELIYEPNEYKVDSTTPSQSTVYTSKSYSVSDYYGGTTASQNASFTLTGNTRVKLYFIVINDNYASNPNEQNLYSTMTAVLRKSDGNQILDFSPSVGLNASYAEEFEAHLSIDLPAGNYEIETNNHSKDYLLMQLDVNYDEETAITKNSGGGLRIASIIAKDNGNEVLRTDYNYTDSSGNATGKLLTPLRTYYVDGLFFAMTSTAVPMATSAQGSPIGYDMVTVSKKDGSGTPLGSTTYQYTNQADWLHTNSLTENSLPGIPTTNHISNGKLLSEKVYNNNGDMLKSTSYTYQTYDDLGIPYEDEYQVFGLISSQNPYICPNPGGADGTPTDRIQYYFFHTEWNYMTNKTETVYDLNGLNPVVTNYGYGYANPDHKNMTYSGMTNSKGESVASSMAYPADQPTGTGMSTANLNAMVAANMHNPVIKQSSSKSGAVLSTQINTFKHWDIKNTPSNTSDDVFLSEFVKIGKGANTPATRIEYIDYDDQGRVLEVKQSNGMPISYVWGYNQTQPVAKIENASYSQVLATGINLTTINSLSTSDSAMRTELDKIRNGLTSAMVTTYTYDPLVGITSVKDPKGYTTYYDYDEFNRLYQIKDADGNILSQNEYHFKNLSQNP